MSKIKKLAPCCVLVADCPWRFDDRLPSSGLGARGAARHYRTLSVEELQGFRLPPLADSGVAFFWRVAAMQPEALLVLSAWGMRVKAELVWVKTTACGVACGMGHYTRGAHEVCLIATWGRGIKPAARNVPSVFFAPRGRHSEKPEAFWQAVEALYPLGPPGEHRELFARRTRPGWVVAAGDEVPDEG